MSTEAINTLVLHADYVRVFSYYDDWLDAFREYPGFQVTTINVVDRNVGKILEPAIAVADLVVLLHSVTGDTVKYLRPLTTVLQHRRGRLLAFVGNEVNLPGTLISAKRKVLEQISPEFIATQLPLKAGQFLFGDLAKNRVLEVPHALNPGKYLPGPNYSERAIDIGTRVARYLPHLGDDDRNRIHDYFTSYGASRFGFKMDLSNERMTRGEWADFLQSCRGTVSTEAGSWYLEKDDHTVESIRGWARRREKRGYTLGADSILNSLVECMPSFSRPVLKAIKNFGLVKHELAAANDLSFEEVHEEFFKNYKKPEFYGKCISSRHFDAVGTKTCQIMFSGRFNDILVAGKHYIALERDFSNIDEVIERFTDADHWKLIVDEAYESVMDQHTYHHRLQRLYGALTCA